MLQYLIGMGKNKGFKALTSTNKNMSRSKTDVSRSKTDNGGCWQGDLMLATCLHWQSKF